MWTGKSEKIFAFWRGLNVINNQFLFIKIHDLKLEHDVNQSDMTFFFLMYDYATVEYRLKYMIKWLVCENTAI